MLDLTLRAVKDRVFDPVCKAVPASISPLHLTGLALICGLSSCYSAAIGGSVLISLSLWALNRVLDCLDGAVARQRQQTSELGGFLDLLGDFIVYSLIPIACAMSPLASAGEETWLAVSLLEAAIHINNFVLFYVAAVVEKKKNDVAKKVENGHGKQRQKELTSVAMMPALIEGFESGTIFTVMLGRPQSVGLLSSVMAVLVFAGTMQRVAKVISVLRK